MQHFRINLCEDRNSPSQVFLKDPKSVCKTIDMDGLPFPGRLYMEGDPYYSSYELEAGVYHVHKFKYAESAFCGSVRIVEESETNNTTKGKCVSTLRCKFFTSVK